MFLHNFSIQLDIKCQSHAPGGSVLSDGGGWGGESLLEQSRAGDKAEAHSARISHGRQGGEQVRLMIIMMMMMMMMTMMVMTLMMVMVTMGVLLTSRYLRYQNIFAKLFGQLFYRHP